MRDELINILKDNICVVSFKKKDGTNRNMKCTLKESIVPKATKEDPLSQKKIRALNEEVVTVWDVEKEGWRSFRVDSVVTYGICTEG